MKNTKTYITLLIGLMLIILIGCNSSDDNPASSPDPSPANTLNGTWKLNNITTDSTGVDSLSVTLNISGSNNQLGGNGSINFSRTSGSATFTITTNSTITGTYSDTNINAVFDDFSFVGNKSGANYTGTATYLITTLAGTDTLTILNAILLSSN